MRIGSTPPSWLCLCWQNTASRNGVGWHTFQHLNQITSPSSFGIPTMSDVFNCKVEWGMTFCRNFRRAKRVQKMNIGYKREPLICKVFLCWLLAWLSHLAPPTPNSEMRISWPQEGCSLQKVILLIPDTTLDGRQGAGIPNPGLRSFSLSSWERVLKTVRTHGRCQEPVR